MADMEAVSFDQAWEQKITETVQLESERIEIYFIGLDHLIQNKKMANRPKDQQDLLYLTALKNRQGK